MIKVPIYNYNFPINFIHKGWSVKMEKEHAFFTMDDLKVKVTIFFDAENAIRNICHRVATVKCEHAKLMAGFSRQVDTAKIYDSVYSDTKSQCATHIREFARQNGNPHTLHLGVRGGMMDRFWGQNISSVDKAVNETVAYIDSNLGDINSKLQAYLKTK